MFKRLLPQRLDNEYRGSKLALWICGLVVLIKSAQSLSIIFAGNYTAAGADGIPLDTFPPAVAQTVLAVFAQQSLWRLTFCLLCLIALLRYRSAVPLMFALLVVNYLAGQVIFHFVPLPRVGTPPGPVVNLITFSLMVVGLALSVWPSTRKARLHRGVDGVTDPDEADDDAKDRLADDLSRLLAGEIPEHEFRAAWQRRDSPAFLDAVWDNLEHYLADADIRAKDPDYRAMQDAELTKLIRLLQERGPVASLRAITFLGSSGR